MTVFEQSSSYLHDWLLVEEFHDSGTPWIAELHYVDQPRSDPKKSYQLSIQPHFNCDWREMVAIGKFEFVLKRYSISNSPSESTLHNVSKVKHFF